MTEVQMTFFDTPHTEMRALWESLERLKISNDKVRKRLFYEIKELEDQVVELRADNERAKFRDETKSLISWQA